MLDLTKVIEGIEALAYDMLMWILLVPKTLAKIVFHPAWAPGYVAEQLKSDARARFDDFISPVILILLSTLLPFAYSYATSAPDVEITGSAQSNISQDVTFTATANFISKDGQYTYDWGEWDGDTYNSYGTWDSNQTTDYISTNWDKPGWETVAVTASNDKGESYYNEYNIYIVDPNQPASTQATIVNEAAPANREPKTWRSVLEGTPGFLAALAFLSIPLLFALAIEAFRGNPLTTSSLMQSFYVQCYYLSPFALASWSLILGVKYFVTPSEFPLTALAGLVVLVLLLQLIRNETLLVAAERSLRRGPAFWVVLGCLALILIVAGMVLLLMGDAEAFRQFLGWFYVAFVVALFLTGFWYRIFRRSAQGHLEKTK